MKNLIIYFSSTGNSFFAAKYLAERLGDCLAVPITKFDPNLELDSFESIGFVFPTYFFSIPKFFSQGIEKLNLSKETYFYGITTCNGFYGNTGYQLKALLDKKGCGLSLFNVLKMPGNYIIEYSPASKNVIDRKITASEQKLSAIVPTIKGRDTMVVKKKFALISRMFFNFMYRSQSRWHEKFHVNSKCSSCGLCEKICQFDNIVNDDGKPRWKESCEHCVACIQLCPSRAIEYGTKTARRGRYVNPRVSVGDLVCNSQCWLC